MGWGELGIRRGGGGSGAAGSVWVSSEACGGAEGDVVALTGAVGVCGEE